MACALVFALAAGTLVEAQVSFERILRADQEPQNWLTYSGNLSGWRYSPLTQITPANVEDLWNCSGSFRRGRRPKPTRSSKPRRSSSTA